VSLPGLTGQSGTHGRNLLDRPVEPGDDGEGFGTQILSGKILRFRAAVKVV